MKSRQADSAKALTIDSKLVDELIAFIPTDVLPDNLSRSESLVLAARYICTENQRLQRTLKQRDQQVRELATERLIWNTAFSDETVEELSDRYGLSLGGNLFLLVLVRIPGLDGPEHTMDIVRNRLIIREYFESALADRYGLNHAVVRNDEFLLLSTDDHERGHGGAYELVRQLSEKAVKQIKVLCGRSPIICIGPPASDTATIRSAFKTLMDMREYTMALADNSGVITIDDFPNYKPFDPDDRPFMSMAVEKQYINAVIARDFSLACQLTMEKIDELMAESINGQRTLKPFIEARMEATADLLVTSLTAIVSGGASVQSDLDTIKATSEHEIICSCLEQAFDRMDNYFNHSENEFSGTAGKVIKFVIANYHNPSLSVEIICDEMGKSRSYLSRMFKENTGMNLLDFLHTTRITEAKRLLTETGLSVAEIGEKVGYYSGWTLARVFKRYEGITPSAYREAYRRGDLITEGE